MEGIFVYRSFNLEISISAIRLDSRFDPIRTRANENGTSPSAVSALIARAWAWILSNQWTPSSASRARKADVSAAKKIVKSRALSLSLAIGRRGRADPLVIISRTKGKQSLFDHHHHHLSTKDFITTSSMIDGMDFSIDVCIMLGCYIIHLSLFSFAVAWYRLNRSDN